MFPARRVFVASVFSNNRFHDLGDFDAARVAVIPRVLHLWASPVFPPISTRSPVFSFFRTIWSTPISSIFTPLFRFRRKVTSALFAFGSPRRRWPLITRHVGARAFRRPRLLFHFCSRQTSLKFSRVKYSSYLSLKGP